MIQLIIQPCVKDDPILCELIQAGDRQAKQELCIKYQVLVRKYARAYLSVYGNNLDIENLEQFGYLGLLIAAEKFDFSYHNTFSTYATFWIKQSISRGIANFGFTVRLPIRLLNEIGKSSRLDKYYEREGLGQTERMEAIADALSIEVSKVGELLSIKKCYMNLASLNVSVEDDQDNELEELLEDTQQISIENQVVDSALSAAINIVLLTLTEREEYVIKLRFGIGCECDHTLEQIGEILHLTRERVRQIENEAMRKLRNPYRSQKLKGFLLGE